MLYVHFATDWNRNKVVVRQIIFKNQNRSIFRLFQVAKIELA